MKLINWAIFAALNLFGVLLFSWPLFISSANPFLKNLTNATWLAALLGFAAILILGMQISERLLDSKSVAIVAVLVGLISALRLLGAGAIGLEPMWFLLILAARVFDIRLGWSIAMLSMLVSAFMTGGIGPWLPFQVFAAGWIALGVKLIPKSLSGKSELVLLSIYGVLSSLFFGAMMDLQLWPWLLGTQTQLSFIPGASLEDNLSRFVLFHSATALAWDIPRALLTSILILISGKAILASLIRAQFRLSAVSQWRIANERAKVEKVA